MRPQAVALAAVLALVGLWALLGVLNRHEIGGFASSPQMLEVPLGARRIAAGGRAVVSVVAIDGDQLVVEISCRDETRQLAARLGDPFETLCGIDVLATQVLGYAGDPDRPRRLLLSVLWDERAGDPSEL